MFFTNLFQAMVVNENVSYINLENPRPEPVKIKITASPRKDDDDM